MALGPLPVMVSVGEQDALAQEVGAGSSVHLPFDHLAAVDVAFDGAGAPGRVSPAVTAAQSLRSPAAKARSSRTVLASAWSAHPHPRHGVCVAAAQDRAPANDVARRRRPRRRWLCAVRSGLVSSRAWQYLGSGQQKRGQRFTAPLAPQFRRPFVFGEEPARLRAITGGVRAWPTRSARGGEPGDRKGSVASADRCAWQSALMRMTGCQMAIVSWSKAVRVRWRAGISVASS